MEAPCARQQQLMAEVQRHLVRLADLAHEEAEALKVNGSREWLAIDKEIEFELGEKERALGALKGHRQEHGC
jgi:hypothetical protein